MTRRNFLAASAAVPAASAQTRASRPNILFILADDLGYGDLGCYGQKRIRTPHIDRLAADGMRFTQAYSGATVCAPSRCCLMTGRHGGHATVRGNMIPELGLKKGETTVASMLKAAGYRTALFGKWGLGGYDMDSHPNDKGFGQFFGYLNQVHAHNSFPDYIWDNKTEYFVKENWFDQKKSFSNDMFTGHALRFIEAGGSEPFFLYLSLTIPHADNERGAYTKNGIETPSQGQYASEKWPEVEKNFAAAVTHLDGLVAKVLAALDAKGIRENTLVIFSSDNGPHKEGGHDANFFQSSGAVRGTKRDLYEGGIRVPTIANWKGKIRPGQVSDFPWAFWDFLPTAAEAAGLKPPAGIDGVSILPALTGKPQKPHEYFYWEFYEGGFQQAVRQGDWKLVRQAPKLQLELFDLKSDLKELRDVSAQNPEVVARLQQYFKTAHADHPQFPTDRKVPVTPY